MEYEGDGDGNAHIEIDFKHFQVVSSVGDHELCTQAEVYIRWYLVYERAVLHSFSELCFVIIPNSRKEWLH